MLERNVALNNKTILVTGAAGFIGAHLVKRLIEDVPGIRVVGVDYLNDYYDPALKTYRLEQLNRLNGSFTFVRGSIADQQLMESLFEQYRFSAAVNLAAQAGVRYSIDHPDVYIESNIQGFFRILECCDSEGQQKNSSTIK